MPCHQQGKPGGHEFPEGCNCPGDGEVVTERVVLVEEVEWQSSVTAKTKMCKNIGQGIIITAKLGMVATKGLSA